MSPQSKLARRPGAIHLFAHTRLALHLGEVAGLTPSRAEPPLEILRADETKLNSLAVALRTGPGVYGGGHRRFFRVRSSHAASARHAAQNGAKLWANHRCDGRGHGPGCFTLASLGRWW